MQRVTLLCVGKLKEKFYAEAAAEYVKRLARYCRLSIVELPEERLPENPSRAQIEAALAREASAIRLAEESGAIVLLKGHTTLVTDGQTVYRNRTGNPGMATGGSGDVLAGLLASLLGQGLAPLEAAAAAAWLHGSAGDAVAAGWGEYGLTPGDLIEALPRLLK